MKKIFILRNKNIVDYACEYIRSLQLDNSNPQKVIVDQITRTGEQNAKFHAICGDIAKSGIEWMGKTRTAEQWKILLVSGHAVATKEGSEIVAGLEGEFINLRESTALMTVKRGSSLIEYAIAWATMNGVQLNEEAL